MTTIHPDPTGIREHIAVTVQQIGRFRGLEAEREVRDALRVLEEAGVIGALEVRLADSGRLLPEGGVQRVDHGVIYEGIEIHVCSDRSACTLYFPHVHSHDRTVTTFPDGSELRGPWREVEAGVLGEAMTTALRRQR